MARIKINIKKSDLQNIIDELESKQKFKNESELFKAVCNTDWAKSFKPKPLTPSVIYLRIREFGITFRTKKGKVSRFVTNNTNSHTNNNNNESDNLVKKLPSEASLIRNSDNLQKLVQRAKSGSRKAAIKLKCIECCGFQRSEIKRCEATDCSLHKFRLKG